MGYLNKKFLLPYSLFLIAFICDAMITTHGITHGGSEGNPVNLWLWSIFGQDSLLLKIIYVPLIFSISAFFYKKVNKFIGVLIPYSLFAGHVLGFSTWIFLKNNYFGLDILRSFHLFLVPWGMFILSPIIGLILSALHVKFLEK